MSARDEVEAALALLREEQRGVTEQIGRLVRALDPIGRGTSAADVVTQAVRIIQERAFYSGMDLVLRQRRLETGPTLHATEWRA